MVIQERLLGGFNRQTRALTADNFGKHTNPGEEGETKNRAQLQGL